MKALNNLKFKIKYFIKKFVFFRAMFSPFVRLSFDYNFGDIQWGTPYFLPRKWVKCNYYDALELLDKHIKKGNAMTKPFDTMLEEFMRYEKPVTTKIFNIQFVSLGWKTKWDDVRFEWNPLLSIVLFGKQLIIHFIPKFTLGKDRMVRCDSYWEAWVTYRYRTNKKLSTKERLFELFKQYSCTWESHEKGNEPIKTDYYYQILKPKYLIYYEEYKNKTKEIIEDDES
jgi:hypothetical protein